MLLSVHLFFKITDRVTKSGIFAFELKRISASSWTLRKVRFETAGEHFTRQFELLPQESGVLFDVHPSLNPNAFNNKVQLENHVDLHCCNQVPTEVRLVLRVSHPISK